MILAAQMSRVELCVFLLGRNANANIQDNQGRYWTVNDTPLCDNRRFGGLVFRPFLVAAAETQTDGMTEIVTGA